MQQGHFRRVANTLVAIQLCRRVDSHVPVQQFTAQTTVSDRSGGYRHAVFRQGACLVGTNHRHSPHGLTSMQLSHQIVALQHAPHIQGQRQRDGHRQTLGDGHHNERDGHHEIAQHHLGHAQVVVGVPEWVGQQIVTQEQHKGSNRHAHSYLADEGGQPVELLVERGLHASALRRCAGHLANLRGIAYRRHDSLAASAHHHRRAQQHVVRIGRLRR